MNLSNQYIAPQEAATLVYGYLRGRFDHPFDSMSFQSSGHSFNRNGKAKTSYHLCTVEMERNEPYQSCGVRVDVDLYDDHGKIQFQGSGMHSLYVFPSDADALELWLIQFKCHLRKEFSKDKDND